MTVHDLVGIPFPRSAPLFANDAPILAKVRRVEDLVEIHNELTGLEHQIDAAEKLISADPGKILDIAGVHIYLIQAVTIGCVVTYAKNFKSSARLMLQASAIYRAGDLLDMHDFLMDLRDKWFAHQELVGDKHHLFLFQDHANARVKLNPYGQHHHVLVGAGLDWAAFRNCVGHAIAHLKIQISDAYGTLESSLSKEQVEFLNGLDRDSAINDYWDQQPHNRRDPFTPREA